MSPGIRQKLFRIRKLLHIPTGRGKQTSHPLQNSGIVIQQADGSGVVKQSESTIHRSTICAKLDLSLMPGDGRYGSSLSETD